MPFDEQHRAGVLKRLAASPGACERAGELRLAKCEGLFRSGGSVDERSVLRSVRHAGCEGRSGTGDLQRSERPPGPARFGAEGRVVAAAVAAPRLPEVRSIVGSAELKACSTRTLDRLHRRERGHEQPRRLKSVRGGTLAGPTPSDLWGESVRAGASSIGQLNDLSRRAGDACRAWSGSESATRCDRARPVGALTRAIGRKRPPKGVEAVRVRSAIVQRSVPLGGQTRIGTGAANNRWLRTGGAVRAVAAAEPEDIDGPIGVPGRVLHAAPARGDCPASACGAESVPFSSAWD